MRRRISSSRGIVLLSEPGPRRRGMRSRAHRLDSVLVGVIRRNDSGEIEAEAETQAEVREALEAQVPAGHVLTDATVAMIKHSTRIRAVGKYRHTETAEIEADDRAALDAKVPEGWSLMSVRLV